MVHVVLFYKYFLSSSSTRLLRNHREYYVNQLYLHQRDLCHRLNVKGRVLLGGEGINGTVSAENEFILQEYMDSMEGFHLVRCCGLPLDATNVETEDDESLFFLYSNIDWKLSNDSNDTRKGANVREPFPDLKISIVNEIVSTGGAVQVDEIVEHGGKHLSPRDFHKALESNKDAVLIDVRNTFEYDIGHFVNPQTSQAALNPETVTFSSFDATFCAKQAPLLQDKKVLMYCTGGIRCEKASAMLRKRGVKDVSQLQGGIHRYLEEYGDGGFFRGKNFVFDQRVAVGGKTSEVVGKCVECQAPFDEIAGSRLCTVCRDLVLVCKSCQKNLREYHCRRHAAWKLCYFTFLDAFDETQLRWQRNRLREIRESLEAASSKNVRRTLQRQIVKVQKRIDNLLSGSARVDRDAPRRCRTCMETQDICDGNCWGFWKQHQKRKFSNLDAIREVRVGDRVEPGPHWNELRLGDKRETDGSPRIGRVVELKTWASGGDERDCVAVVWDVAQREGKATDSRIYRWGFVARNGERMYDVVKQQVKSKAGKDSRGVNP